MSAAPRAPSPAATVLLLRSGPAGLEVLMQRRGASLAFMGGMWVFPGGRHEPADRSPAMLDLVRAPAGGVTLCAPDGSPLDRELALGLYVTACRETFEESGVLLATGPDGTAHGLDVQSGRIVRLRATVSKDAGAFAALLRDEGLCLDVSRLVYWSHWITPAGEKRRFDTRFFATVMAPSLVTGATDEESAEQAWIRPADALARIAAGAIAAAPPTTFTLEDLVECEAAEPDITLMLEHERGREMPPIRPLLASTGDGYEVRLPWDAEYEPDPREPLVRPASYPGRYARRPSRVRIDPGFALRQIAKGPAA